MAQPCFGCWLTPLRCQRALNYFNESYIYDHQMDQEATDRTAPEGRILAVAADILAPVHSTPGSRASRPASPRPRQLTTRVPARSCSRVTPSPPARSARNAAGNTLAACVLLTLQGLPTLIAATALGLLMGRRVAGGARVAIAERVFLKPATPRAIQD